MKRARVRGIPHKPTCQECRWRPRTGKGDRCWSLPWSSRGRRSRVKMGMDCDLFEPIIALPPPPLPGECGTCDRRTGPRCEGGPPDHRGRRGKIGDMTQTCSLHPDNGGREGGE